MGAIMAFFALLFAVSPTLEAAACVAQGCGVTCVEQTSGGAEQQPGQCDERHCICLASHCSHVGVWPSDPILITVVTRSSAAAVIVSEHPVSATSQTPERPPRI